MQQKKETKLREQEGLFSEVEKVALYVEKNKGKEKTFNEHWKEFEKEIKELSPLDNEAPRPMKNRNVTMKKKVLRPQFKKKRVGKTKRKSQENEEEVGEESELEGLFITTQVSK